MTTVSESPQSPAADESEVEISAGIRRQVADALYLLDYAVESGFKTKEGATLSEDVVAIIKITAGRVGVTEGSFQSEQLNRAIEATGIVADRKWLKTTDWRNFELGYYKLAQFTAPVTAETLRATEVTSQWVFHNMSASQKFSKLLWLITMAFAAFTVGADWGLQHYGPVQDGVVDRANSIMQLVQILIPFTYGGLGACVYLLRSAHSYIVERTFDVRRKPEYFNRIILGTIGGGAIVLFVNHVTTDDGQVIQLSAAALGFLGGYSTDFLFNTIERVISAILPKVGLQSVRTSTSDTKPPLGKDSVGVTLKELIDRFEDATGENKDLYKSLIEKLRDRV